MLHYQEFGVLNKPALILLFGFSMSSQEWVDFGYIQLLKPHFHVTAIEPRGHGASLAPHNPSEYTLTSLISDIHTLLVQLKVDKAICWGYSLGAKLALALAQAHPELVTGLILGGFEAKAHVKLTDDLVCNTLKQGGKAWLALWEQMFNVPDKLAKRLLSVKNALICA